MESKIKNLIEKELESINVIVDSIVYESEGNTKYLRICIDSSDTLDTNLIVKATHIINPILDKEDLIKEAYILDIYGKSKGE